MLVDLFAAIGCYVVLRYALRSWRNHRYAKRIARRRALVVLPR